MALLAFFFGIVLVVLHLYKACLLLHMVPIYCYYHHHHRNHYSLPSQQRTLQNIPEWERTHSLHDALCNSISLSLFFPFLFSFIFPVHLYLFFSSKVPEQKHILYNDLVSHHVYFLYTAVFLGSMASYYYYFLYIWWTGKKDNITHLCNVPYCCCTIFSFLLVSFGFFFTQKKEMSIKINILSHTTINSPSTIFLQHFIFLTKILYGY